ncbi:MAG: type I restriction enzyme HsdR N-terminal domain-containing protein [Saprospiraceae bacterium]|nr:type I restriction enzyme HsdR N-terminal domain-containing protein [Saprospiraceae bacterium]
MAYLPEETVRQLFIHYCIDSGLCPAGRISVERELEVLGMRRRYDLVLFDTSGLPWMLVECKAPSVVLSQTAMEQIARYNLTLTVPYLLVTNGWSAFCYAIDFQAKSWRPLDRLPDQTPTDGVR